MFLQSLQELASALFKVKPHRRLKHTKGKYPLVKGHRLRLPGNKPAGHLAPGIPDPALLDSFTQTKTIQNPAHQVSRGRHVPVEVQGFPGSAKFTKHLGADDIPTRQSATSASPA